MPPISKLLERFPDLKYKLLPKDYEHPHYNYNGFKTEVVTLPKGHVFVEGQRALPCDIVLERDTSIRVRDGAALYADIFRPVDSETKKVPAILPWSPYGKTGTGPQNYDIMAPFRVGIPKDQTSGYEKFEAPDPAEWIGRGYAIVNIDARGAGHSEGYIAMWGEQEAEDIYDVIDWLSKQTWCNGSVCMAGNSWLAISQVNFASRLSHPALKAMAPWEAYTDPYRDFVVRGGRAHVPGFHRMIEGGFAGPNGAEDMTGMLKTHPMYDDFWEAKRIPVENIDGSVPMYFLASYSSMLHTRGSFDTFNSAKTKKWLRVHPYQEWFDLYRPEINDELQRYFDFYSKGIQNGWEEETPAIRLSLLGFENSTAETVVERPEARYPPADVEMTSLYLNSEGRSLQRTAPEKEGSVKHEGHHLTDSSDFIFFFNEDVELIGYPMLRVCVSCQEHDDLDIVCQIRKVDSTGKLLEHLNYPCPVPVEEVPDYNTCKYIGTQGILRASHRVSKDEATSSPDRPFYTHRIRQPISPGDIVQVDIPIWPIGFVVKKGEGIMLRIAGHDMCLPETEMARETTPEDENVGMHRVHCGGNYASVLRLPVRRV